MLLTFSWVECFWTLMTLAEGVVGFAYTFQHDMLRSLKAIVPGRTRSSNRSDHLRYGVPKRCYYLFQLTMKLSWIETYWVVCTVVILLPGLMVLLSPLAWPFLTRIFTYGKAIPFGRNDLISKLQIPKQWFTHFYIWAIITSEVAFMLSLLHISKCEIYDLAPVQSIDRFLSFIRQPLGSLSINDEAIPARLNQPTIVLCTGLLLLHVLRRFYESAFVSVYSDSKINAAHYILGLAHYFMLPCSIVAEGTALTMPPFTYTSEHKVSGFSFTNDILSQFTIMQWLGIALFLYACVEQHLCFRKLASLRRNNRGEVNTYAHSIPRGGWFEYVTCPHFFFELLIYLSLWLCQSLTWNTWVYVVAFVLVNQSIAGWITRDWYLHKFSELYPKNRAVLIPFIF